MKNYHTDKHNKGSGRQWQTGTLSIRLSNFKNKPKFYSKENKLAAKEKEAVGRKLKTPIKHEIDIHKIGVLARDLNKLYERNQKSQSTTKSEIKRKNPKNRKRFS
ncbi:hypothetical protein [Draconibacterium orientale]|uniref:hypothetical protein n=1 Tax=Draconibacterium orientale TaxID=1168034 RepID=UPI002ABE9434|nr:hypothetical protein [Draconibacterium orientale]